MGFARKLSFLVLLLCLLMALKNQNVETNRILEYPLAERNLQVNDSHGNSFHEELRYDYYNESCPSAKQIIRSTVQKLFMSRRDVAASLLRLVFHDCFVEGCDASVLLDSAHGFESEKVSVPNLSLKGFDAIDSIKSKLELKRPGIVSCADTLVLAAREAVLLAGGPFYPLLTGRKDSTVSYPDIATREIPSPDNDLNKTIHLFPTRGFDEREIVSLLGAHSTGTIHCQFINNRLLNFRDTDGPDTSIDNEFLEVLRSKCSTSHHSSAPSAENSSSENPGMRMDYKGPGKGFGTVYYHSLVRSKGLLFVDQQMTAGEVTETWVRAYASHVTLFHRDFGLSMIKLSNYKAKTGPMGQVRLNCRKVNSKFIRKLR